MPSSEIVDRPFATGVGITSAATTNGTSQKATPGEIFELIICNPSAAAKFVKFYDKASAPTVGTDIPKYRFAVAAGATLVAPLPSGLPFLIGIAYAITGAAADTDATAVAANDVFLNFRYL